MSYSATDYPTATQERFARIHGIDLGEQYCPTCDKSHREGYRFTGCSQPPCETIGCHECLRECQLHGGGMFCADHLSDVGGSAACVQCERLDLDADDLIEREERQAA